MDGPNYFSCPFESFHTSADMSTHRVRCTKPDHYDALKTVFNQRRPLIKASLLPEKTSLTGEGLRLMVLCLTMIGAVIGTDDGLVTPMVHFQVQPETISPPEE